jgi:galactose mutarotase-like enzyme
MTASVEQGKHGGVASITLRAGPLSATFLPEIGMTGVSLRFGDDEYLAVPGGVAALRAGSTAGLPLLAPWANRLASRRYRAAGASVDLEGLPLTVDANGLPIHGLLVGASGWRVDGLEVRRDNARLRASIDLDSPAFPFPHRVEVSVLARDRRLEIDTTLIPTGRRRVPIAFGWHPYLRLPGAARSRWRLELPARRHLSLDRRGIPTGVEAAEPAESSPIGRRTFDDLYRFGRSRRMAFSSGNGLRIELRCDSAYPFGQVWVPEGRDFAALEPMAAPTNALVAGTAPLVGPGDSFTARFTLQVGSATS